MKKISPLRKSLGTTKSTLKTPEKSIPSTTVNLGDMIKSPILYIDVLLSADDPAERIPIYKGDKVEDVVKDFIER